ncbi:hypothetical protein NGRA_0633 [Nosema granulosis]|uniref:AB hydrolase-1 domain-containing protein n=1 Tax=Nosema granulosis TaxID=83296 RepID=A0A9P6H0H8_9MICR|nr:hypothetical protein NGRA_0633 [Nosema granulosis]
MDLKRIFMNIFLGIPKLRTKEEYFDNIDRILINKHIQNQRNEDLYGYISRVDQNKDYKGCIIILHGISDNRKDFFENYWLRDNMRDDFLYVIPDFPGFGESKLSFTKIGCYEMILNWMCVVKKDYGLNKFIIVGQSFGSTLGLDFYRWMSENDLLDTKETDKSEKFYLKKLILYSPFAVTHVAVLQYYLLGWANRVLGPIVRYLVNEEIDFDLTNLPKKLDPSIVELIYTPGDSLVPYTNSLMILENFKAKSRMIEAKNHINLFICNEVWQESYNNLIDE